MQNAVIREAAQQAGVKLWQIADRIGVCEGTFCRKLRHELPEDQRRRVMAVINELAKKGSVSHE